jgi:hypothetical protein
LHLNAIFYEKKKEEGNEQKNIPHSFALESAGHFPPFFFIKKTT